MQKFITKNALSLGAEKKIKAGAVVTDKELGLDKKDIDRLVKKGALAVHHESAEPDEKKEDKKGDKKNDKPDDEG